MQIYVITLPGADQRQQQAARQLEKAGVSYQFFPAVSGEAALKSDSCKVDEQAFVMATGREHTSGEIGCFASHRLAWKMCVRLDEPIMIMEDDFSLSDNFADAHSLVKDAIGQFGFLRLQSETRASKRKVRQQGAFTIWRYTKAPNSAMCYALSPAAARALVHGADVFTAPVDIYLKWFWQHGQVMYGVTPYAVTESTLSSDSYIGSRVKAKKTPLTRLRRSRSRLRDYFSRHWFNISKKKSL